MKNYRSILDFCLLSAIICLVTIYALAYSWNADGFDQGEVIWLAVLPGLITFVVSLVLISISLSRYLKKCQAEGAAPAKWWQLLLGTTGLTTVFLVAIDALFYYLADQSLSLSFAEALSTFDQRSGDMKEATMQSFASLPFLLQNVVSTAIFILLANALAVGIAKYLNRQPALELR